MKKRLAILFLIMLFWMNRAVSQESNINIYFGQVFSKFRYENSEGERDKFLNNKITYTYGINGNILFDNFFARPGISYINLGSQSVINNTVVDWSLHYVGFEAAPGYTFEWEKFDLYGGAGFYFNFLYKADQVIGDKQYDLIANNSLKTFDTGIVLFLGFNYKFSGDATIFTELKNGNGLYKLEKKSGERLLNSYISINFGLRFDIEV